MEQPNNPHDSLFKATFSDREVARAYLLHFLPKEIIALLELETLSLQSGTYIGSSLGTYFSDIIYSCRYKSQELQISLLFEHKSYPPTYPHIQLLRYMVEAWERMIKNDDPLQLIIPVVVYHGKGVWKHRSLESYFGEVPTPLKPFIPSFEFVLTDLFKYSNDELEKINSIVLQSTFTFLKNRGNKTYLQTIIPQTFSILQGEYLFNYVEPFFVYLLYTSGIPEENFILLFEEIPSDIKNRAMTTYEQMKNRVEKEEKLRFQNHVIIQGIKKGLDLETLTALTGLSLEELVERIEQLDLEV